MFGELSDCGVVTRKSTDFQFIQATVKLNGWSFSLEYPLTDFLPKKIPSSLRAALKDDVDANWVWARISREFETDLSVSQTEKSLLHQGFLALTNDLQTAYPFVCSDYYGKTKLMFSKEGPETALKEKIAADFWGLLLQRPNDLTSFNQKVFHPGVGIWMNFGCKGGIPHFFETNE
jgi:hypothetical protein